jgi:very-short-patch-repair endonuclease
VTVADAIPCTSVACTLLDLAAVEPDRVVENACDRAEQLQIFDLRALEDILARNPRAQGAGRLRRVLRRLDSRSGLTRSEIERLFLALCRDHGLPPPLVNQWIQLDGFGFEPDFLWPEQRLIVETDGGAVHRTRRAFEDDRRRDQLLAVAGYTTLRFTWRQLTDEPERVAFTIKTVLGAFGYPHVP